MNWKYLLLTGVSLVAATMPAAAQTAPAADADQQAEGDEIIVTGIRASLAKSLEAKRASNRTEDVISAEDVSKFPDQNVAEALQRVPGVQLQRDNGEGRFVSVRGLGPEFNVVTLNGRLLATDGTGREFSFDTLPSELINSAAVIKSPTADLLEGSIGGTVDVRTARPLDMPGLVVAGSAAGTIETERGDLAPRASALVSWSNDAGTFGILGTVNYSKRKLQLDRFDINGYFRASQHGFVLDGAGGAIGCAAPGNCTTPTLNDAWVPQAVDYVSVSDVRTRKSATLTLQAKPTDSMTITLDGLYSKYSTTSEQSAFAVFARDFQFDSASIDDASLNIDTNKDGNLGDASDEIGARVTKFTKDIGTSDLIRSASPRDTETYLVGLNVQGDPASWLKVNVDASYSRATNTGINTNYFYVTGADFSAGGLGAVYDATGGSRIPDFAVSAAAFSPANQRAHYIQRNGSNTKDGIFDFSLGFQALVGDGFIRSIDFGGRYTRREKTIVGSFSTNNFCGIVCGRGLDYNEAGVFTGTADTLGTFSGNFPRQFSTYDSDAYIAALDKVVPGLAQGLQAVPTPSQKGSITEDVKAAYIQANFGSSLGAIPFSGNLGVRYVKTDGTSRGFGGNLISLIPSPTAQDTTFVFDNAGQSAFSSGYGKFLPSLNVKFELARQLVLRFDASKVITRPTLSNLLPAITAQDQGYQRESLVRGNPELAPFTASQAGASLEWYFDRTGAFFASVFYKELNNRVFTASVRRTFPGANGTNPATYLAGPGAGQPILVNISQPQNTGKERIYGAEIGFQKTFDFLPGFLSGLGVQANYTYLNSRAEYDTDLVSKVFGTDTVGAAAFLANPPRSGQGLSKHSFNVAGFYEKGPISLRVAYNWRDQYLRSPISGPNGWALYERARGQLDVNASVAVMSGVSVFVEGTNLLQAGFSRFYDNGSTKAFDQFQESENYYGRTVAFGIRSRF